MALTVNTLAEVPGADTYIVELGLEGTAHPANEIARSRIRDELEVGEWYVQTGDDAEEQDLIMQIEGTVDRARLPAYLVLTSHPEDAEEGIALYLDEVESEDEAWELLRTAVSEMRSAAEPTPNTAELTERIRTAVAEHGGLSLSANAVTLVGFGLEFVPI